MKLPETADERRRLAIFAALGLAAFALFHRLSGSIDVESLLEDLSSSLGAWTYLLVGGLAFLETGAFVGLIAPGEAAIVLGGAVAGQGDTSLALMIAIVWFSAWLGDTASFFIGRRLGREFILRHGPRFHLGAERFDQVESYFDRHGGKTILIGRFVGVVRALAPFVAGSSKMEYRRMLPFSVLGTGLWGSAFTLIGFFASKNIGAVLDSAGRITFLLATAIVVIVSIVVVVRRLREPLARAKLVAAIESNQLGARALVALRRIEPQLRFLANRLTPGELGLELTGLLAAAAVGGFAFIAYFGEFDAASGATSTDRAGFDVVRQIDARWLTDLANFVTDFGDTGLLTVAIAAAAVVLGWRRAWPELTILVISVGVLHFGVDAAKQAVERPRPAAALFNVEGFAYPSGHAAYSVFYPWLAMAATVRLKPAARFAGPLIVIGFVAAAAIGLSRVYLRVHYLSDVVGGWGFGVAVFAAVSAIVMVFAHLRHNQGDGPDRSGS